MKSQSLFSAFLLFPCLMLAQDPIARARQLQREGDFVQARAVLLNANRGSSSYPVALAYAELLDLHGDAEARAAYERAWNLAPAADKARIARRIIILDLKAGDREAALKHQSQFGLRDLNLEAAKNPPAQQATIEIPGPLRSFARMAALSPELQPDELLPALARNVVTNGYQAVSSNEALEQTEYLKLVIRYLSQAREIEKLAGPERVLRIETCESSQTADLLRVLGYRIRGGCGSEVILETVNASRAFLTIDSGFPIAELEQALRTNRPFVYDFKPAVVPVLYSADYWIGKDKPASEFIDIFLHDPAMCRLYLGLSKLDSETAEELKKAMPFARLKAFAHVLDFYGAMFRIRNGEAWVPGGPRAAPGWAALAGVDPKSGAAFYERLLTRDDGWMASFFDSLARIDGPVRDYLTEPNRMQRFYLALRGRVTSPGPARPVFRANTDMILLTQRLRLEPDGRPHIPGNLEVWRNLFIQHPHGKYDGKLTRLASTWKEPDDLIEALFALCRKAVENEPLKIYMAISDLNRFRTQPLEPATVDRLAREYRQMGAQYALFSEAPTLSDKTILQFLDTAAAVNRIRDMSLRANTAGILQALAGLWQIFTRQGTLPATKADTALAGILSQFGEIRGNRELFDAGRAGVRVLLEATNTPAGVSPQDRIIDLLAGAANPRDTETHRQVVESMIRIFEAQRLVALDTLFDLSDNLERVAKGEGLNTTLVARLAAKISELQLPRSALSSVEKNTMAFGYWTEKHIEAQRRVNLRAAIERAGNDPEKLRDIRAQLTPFLRDTLVGFNYIHYAPPGAQVLMTNPLFVRSHDFLGLQGAPQTWKATEVFGTGWPSNAGGRLIGSLATLPYALAEAEQNFLIPTREQALIWGDLVPQMIVSAKVPRWWSATPAQLRWIALHLNAGESLIVEGSLNRERRAEVLQILGDRVPPARVEKIGRLLEQGKTREALDLVIPSEAYFLAQAWWKKHPNGEDALSGERQRLLKDHAEEVSPAAISRAFGTPKPTLANSFRPELLNLPTFPTLMGYSSRIMAESWESNLLYFAALAHELNMQPSQLNVTVPEWTQQTVERIFATHLEDWPALLRSLRLVAEDVRTKGRKTLTAAAAGQAAVN
jgi:hypothetical protein